MITISGLMDATTRSCSFKSVFGLGQLDTDKDPEGPLPPDQPGIICRLERIVFTDPGKLLCIVQINGSRA